MKLGETGKLLKSVSTFWTPRPTVLAMCLIRGHIAVILLSVTCASHNEKKSLRIAV